MSWNSSTRIVAVALAEPGEHRGPLAQQRERPVDLVAEVHEPRLAEQPLVSLVEGRQLEVPLGLVPLLGRRRRGELPSAQAR